MRKTETIRVMYYNVGCTVDAIYIKKNWLKVPKCESFDRSDFYDFYTIKSLSVDGYCGPYQWPVYSYSTVFTRMTTGFLHSILSGFAFNQNSSEESISKLNICKNSSLIWCQTGKFSLPLPSPISPSLPPSTWESWQSADPASGPGQLPLRRLPTILNFGCLIEKWADWKCLLPKKTAAEIKIMLVFRDPVDFAFFNFFVKFNDKHAFSFFH
jgi:hypothetical protein